VRRALPIAEVLLVFKVKEANNVATTGALVMLRGKEGLLEVRTLNTSEHVFLPIPILAMYRVSILSALRC
jgi:hypothetical protein